MISDEAVEAAAREIREYFERIETPQYAAMVARAALEAAAPHMQLPPRRRDPDLIPYLMAKAWDEGRGAEAWPDCAVSCGACNQCATPATSNPYRRQP